MMRGTAVAIKITTVLLLMLAMTSAFRVSAPTYDVRGVQIPEDIKVNSRIIQIDNSDYGESNFQNEIVEYTLESDSTGLKTFRIDKNTGEIFTMTQLDYELISEYFLQVFAKKNGEDARIVAKVNVKVTDVNDNRPIINLAMLTDRSSQRRPIVITKSMNAGDAVVHVTALDNDSGPNGKVSCSIDDRILSIEPVFGFEGKGQYLLAIGCGRSCAEENGRNIVTLICKDNGQPPLKSKKEYINVTVE